MEKIKQIATKKLSELLGSGYRLLLNGDTSYGNNVSVKLEKDGNNYLFAVDEKLDYCGVMSIDVLCISLYELCGGFVRDNVWQERYYRVSSIWRKPYFTKNRQEAINAVEKRYARCENRCVDEHKEFKCASPKLLAFVRNRKGFKRAKEVIVNRYENRWSKGYQVTFGDKFYNVEFKGAC